MTHEFLYCLKSYMYLDDNYAKITHYFQSICHESSSPCYLQNDELCTIETNDPNSIWLNNIDANSTDILLVKGTITNVLEVHEKYRHTYNEPDPDFKQFEEQIDAYKGCFATVFYNIDDKFIFAYTKGDMPLYYAVNDMYDIIAISTVQTILQELSGVFRVFDFPKHMYWNGIVNKFLPLPSITQMNTKRSILNLFSFS